MCAHVPQCPAADTITAVSAHVLASHPEQGWYLLCNGVILFDDGGAILPNGSTRSRRVAWPALHSPSNGFRARPSLAG